jgi:steroid 5-alpha reductase family enzyme
VPREALPLSVLALALPLLAMFLVWVLHLRLRDAGIVDVAFAGLIGLLALLYALFASGWAVRRTFIAVMACFWSARLVSHLYLRLKGKPEEGRYQQLRKEWAEAGHDVNRRFLGFFLLQGGLVALFSLPFLLSSLDETPRISPLEVLGIAVWFVALCGESVADAQLNRWKADPANKGRTCRLGLWNYSRHPNYFFEWLVWCGYALYALAAPFGYLALVCPALMLFFLLRVTGIPATEAQALRTRGDDYRDYQRTTSAFVPWIKKTTASA